MTSFDGKSNLAITTVAVAPVSATAGTSLTLATGAGALFTDPPPFNVEVWPSGAQALPTNTEIPRCTALAGDVMTIVRGPQAGDPGGINRTILVGDQIQLAATAKSFKDIESAVNAARVLAFFAG